MSPCAFDMTLRLVLLLLAISLASPAFGAEKKPDPAKEQMRRMQQMQRKLEQEKAQLTQEKTELDGKLKDVEGKLDEARRQAARKAAGLEKELATVQSAKESLTTKLADTEQQLARLTEQQRTTDAERKRLQALAAQLQQSVTGCEAKNENLHKHGVELLERYEKKGCFDAVLQGEPFTGLKQVEIENYREEMRDKLDEQRIGGAAGSAR